MEFTIRRYQKMGFEALRHQAESPMIDQIFEVKLQCPSG